MDSLEKLTIETPEQVRLEYPLAGLGSRFLAVAVDTLWQVIAAVVAALALVFLVPVWAGVGSGLWAMALWVIFYFLLFWGYFAFFEIFWNGQTPGKRQAKIRVIKENGRPITAYDALIRNLLRVVDLLPGMYGLGVCCIAISKQNKRLGDYAAGTVVVHDAPAEDVEPVIALTAANGSGHHYPASRISMEELILIETFLQRRYDLSPDVRTETARKIAGRIRERLALETIEEPEEDFLAHVAHSKRSAASM